MNVKLNYVMLQSINAAFFLLSYLFVSEHFHTSEGRTLGGFLVVAAVIMAAAYVFFTNRIFYVLIKQTAE